MLIAQDFGGQLCRSNSNSTVATMNGRKKAMRREFFCWNKQDVAAFHLMSSGITLPNLSLDVLTWVIFGINIHVSKTILITGGAGFIGRAVSRELLGRGYGVRVLDALHPQVHSDRSAPAEIEKMGAELVEADVRDAAPVAAALKGCDAVIHLAADVGVGQSMYEISRYTSVNDLGTAVLLEQLSRAPVRRLVTASSMSIYGEGLYRQADGTLVEDARRTQAEGKTGEWDPRSADGEPLTPVPTPEWKRPQLSSVYALNKYVQERSTHIVCGAYGIESAALRLFNVYGPGQALSNPYTGVLAIFASRLRKGRAPLIFEDGQQRRDFVHVRDVARAFADALEKPAADGQTLNIGSGQDRTIEQVARALARALGKPDIEAEITGEARTGDIRHCFCDASLARQALGFAAQEDFEQGLAELAQWVEQQEVEDRVSQARAELLERGLVA